MDFKEKAGKRLVNASTAYSKVYKRNYGELSPINQDQLGINHNFQVRDAMMAVGLSPPDQIIFDGQIHRYKIAGDKRHSNNGWYVFYSDGIFSGSFGSWKTGIKTSWCSKSLKLMSSEEKTEYRRRMVSFR